MSGQHLTSYYISKYVSSCHSSPPSILEAVTVLTPFDLYFEHTKFYYSVRFEISKTSHFHKSSFTTCRRHPKLTASVAEYHQGV